MPPHAANTPVPEARNVVVPAADWYGIEPEAPPARLVAVVADVAVDAVVALPTVTVAGSLH